LNNKIKSVALAAVLSLAIGGAGSISADAATKKPTAKPAAKKPAAKKPAAKPVPVAATTEVQKEITALKASGKKFTYWGGLIFSELSNAAEEAQIKAWGKSRGIPVDVQMVNQNNTVAQVTAALAAGTMPDALDIGSSLMLQLGSKNLLNVQSIVDDIGKRDGGWTEGAAQFDEKTYVGKGLGVPYGVTGNIIFRRLDLLKAAGAKTTAPETWEDLMEAATKTMKVGGAGFALGNVGDAEGTFRAQFASYGGRYADDAGKKCTIDSPASRDFLAFVKKWYDKGAYSPSAVTNDGGWDNNLYIGGKTVFIMNTGSVNITQLNGSAAWPKSDALTAQAKNTGFSALPAGPKLRAAPADGVLRVIPKSTKYPELAKDLIRYLMEKRNMQEYLEYAIYGPVLKGYTFSYWKEPGHLSGLFELANASRGAAWPDVNNAAFGAFGTGFNLSKMVQRHIIDGDSADKTIKEAQAVCQTLYDK
jgi:multiple sugar transport system substrate-binding protein